MGEMDKSMVQVLMEGHRESVSPTYLRRKESNSPQGVKHFSDHCVMLTGQVKNKDPGRIVG